MKTSSTLDEQIQIEIDIIWQKIQEPLTCD